MTDPALLAALTNYQAKDPNQAIDAALAQVQAYCGWHIAPSVTETVSLWSTGGRSVFVATRYLTNVSSVSQDGASIDLSTVTFKRYGAVTRYPGYYFNPAKPVSVGVVHGYATLPVDVRDVVLGLAQKTLNDTRGMVPGPSSAGQVFVESYGPQLSEADKLKLAPYTIPSGFA